MKYEIEVVNEIITDAKNEEEFITAFNQKLAALILHYEIKSILRCCNNA